LRSRPLFSRFGGRDKLIKVAASIRQYGTNFRNVVARGLALAGKILAAEQNPVVASAESQSLKAFPHQTASAIVSW
jgi:hypothetical protein